MLACNHYHINNILEKYRIENITSENNSKIEKYIVVYKIQDFQFIILLSYILFKSIITSTFVSSNYINHKNF